MSWSRRVECVITRLEVERKTRNFSFLLRGIRSCAELQVFSCYRD